MTPTIRIAKAEDIDSIEGIFEASTGAHERQEDWNRLAAAGGLVVAEADQEIVGFGGIDLDAVEQVKWLYVRASHQGSGLGSRILARMEEMGWSAGLNLIRLHSAPGAEQFYRKHGYEAVDPGDLIGHDHDGLELVKRRA
jgi:GNAT superfamily N-acetyltransferase